MTDVDLAVVGAGPAGLSAAAAASESGLSVALVDAGNQFGGQFWRHPDEAQLAAFDGDESTGHHHWARFRALRDRARRAASRGRLRYLPGRHVWRADETGDGVRLRTTVVAGADDLRPEARAVSARRLIVATGAYDRQLPIPGWTTPGVMAAGGVQALLKAHQVSAGSRAVVAGTGPFLMSVAAGLVNAGVEVVAICEANALTRWAATPWRAVQEPGKLIEGVEYAGAFVRHRVPLRTRTAVTRIEGASRVERVVMQKLDRDGAPRPGTERTIDVDLVALGWGFTPQLELPIALGLATRVDVDGSLVVEVDADQRTSSPRVYAAGETTGIGGAVQSCAEGELAAVTACADLGHPVPGASAARLRRRIARGRRFAVGMHLASPVPSGWDAWLEPSTIVCRCEEVTAAEIDETVGALGADDARDVRVTARPGMGWCQGRVCGFPLSKLVERRTGCGARAGDLESLANRPLASPIRLAEIADLGPQ
ncbi:FAD/NAD(P)-dependent oxidoreductase [Microbacterium halophytorum]|uniref:FAD/NAD(P)-dependent oxidoreductase n=1 Tax=Microbacterium halophytorum TaxID=2067568 RepID=UPI000CFDA9F8|nr:(2Fe-2S)-binding protein [Microbacterium halophytorum]